MKRTKGTETIETTVLGYRMAITYDWHAGRKGMRERGTGLPLEPDEEPSFEITGVRMLDPEDIWEMITEDVVISVADLDDAIEKYAAERGKE